MSERRIAVAGAGLAGALMATLLADLDCEVDVIERRADPRLAGALGGRSINLAISTRGLAALAQAGIEHEVLKRAVPMRGRMIHPVHGDLAFQPYGTRGQCINSVSRGDLNRLLIETAAGRGRVNFRFDAPVTGVDPHRGVISWGGADPGEDQYDAIVGADGAYSAVRQQLQRAERFDYQQSYLTHAYKELTIPPGAAGGHQLEPNALHIWPRGGHMMIALPNPDGSFTCTIFWPFEGPGSFEGLTAPEEILRRFHADYPDAVPLMPSLTEDFLRNPTSALVTVRCHPWTMGRVVLLGDAAHAIVPFYGQGANAAFEDCVILQELLRRHRDRGVAFRAFSDERKRHADALAGLAIQNFVEMRDSVRSRRFRLRKRVERLLHRLLPRWYLPLYEMVTFSRIPYADAIDRARRQDQVLRRGATVAALLLATFLWALLT